MPAGQERPLGVEGKEDIERQKARSDHVSGKPNGALDGGKEVDRSEREQKRDPSIGAFVSFTLSHSAQLLERKEESSGSDASEPYDELRVAEVLWRSREPYEGKHQHGREGGEADEGLAAKDGEVVVPCVATWAVPQIVMTVQPSMSELCEVIEGRVRQQSVARENREERGHP